MPMIRHATVEDIPAMVALERDSPYAAHWPESSYQQMFAAQTPTRIALVADDCTKTNARICGFVIARIVGNDCELENIVVGRENQRRGLGSRLVQSLAVAAHKQQAARIFLEVRASNAAARSLYEKCGFSITGRRPSYYSDPVEDAVLYVLQLTGARADNE